MGGLSEENDLDPTVTLKPDIFCTADNKSLLAFVGLQLVFSPDAVVTAEHHKFVRLFLASEDNAALDFLVPFDGLGTDVQMRSQMVRVLAQMVLALARQDEETVPEAVSNPLGVVLANHVNRYIRFRKICASARLVSFADFCRQPKVRFLSQIHRVEAYMAFLYQQTEATKRFQTPGTNPSWPYGLPLVKFFREPPNIHNNSNPGRIILCNPVDTPSIIIRVPAPQYIDPGKGDVVTQMQEIVEHRALSGSELNWEEMYHKWQSGLDLTNDVLEHILVHSPCRMSVLLSMTPIHIVNLNLSNHALKAICQDYGESKHLLRKLTVAEHEVLRKRAAAIWWLLLTAPDAGVSLARDNENDFEENQQLLLKCNIYISENQPGELLSRISRVLIQIDGDDILTKQHAVRNYILSDENQGAVRAILDDQTVRIGSAFINSIVAGQTLREILTFKKGSLISKRFGSLLKWVHNDRAQLQDGKSLRDGDQTKMALQEAMKSDIEFFTKGEGQRIRITPQAVVTLLKSANPPVDLDCFRIGILVPCLTAQPGGIDTDENRQFLSDVLEPLCQQKPELAVELLDMLARPDLQDNLPKPDLHNVAPFWSKMC